jgi:hypothetical protein
VCTTETIEGPPTHAPALDYSAVHHIPRVTPAFIAFLKKPLQFNVWVSPAVREPRTAVSTLNPAVLPNPNSPLNSPLGNTYSARNSSSGVSGAVAGGEPFFPANVPGNIPGSAPLQLAPTEVAIDRAELAALRNAFAASKNRVLELEKELLLLRGSASTASLAVAADSSTGDSSASASASSGRPGSAAAVNSPRAKLEAAKELAASLMTADSSAASGA